MKLIKLFPVYILAIVSMGLLITSCQKLERPQLGDFPKDPPPPPLQILGAQSYWAFDGQVNDTGSFNLETKAKKIAFIPGVTFVEGVTGGEAVNIGDEGYIMVTDVPDALKNPGSISVAFWFKGVGPVQGGAQGVFAISKSTKFWGNLEFFLENLNNGDEAFIKIHMYNEEKEQWIEEKVPDVLNKWSHLAFTYDETNSKAILYVNGEVALEKILDGGNYGPLKFNDVTGLVIGSFAFETDPTLASHGAEPWAKSFNGALDQFRIYTKALTESEVQNLYTNKL